MKDYSVFDIIGPRMTGPSSSHTAGAARLGNIVRRYAGEDIKRAHITLFGSFATTGRGHGTDKAIVAGLLGMEPDDERLRFSMLLAQEADVDISVTLSLDECEHPNTARIEAETVSGIKVDLTGCSVGGGAINVTSIDGLPVEFTGDYPTLVIRHKDVPGVINGVTGILARERINVAFMRVFRHVRSQDAFMVIETDTVVSARAKQLILDWCPEITEVRSV